MSNLISFLYISLFIYLFKSFSQFVDCFKFFTDPLWPTNHSLRTTDLDEKMNFYLFDCTWSDGQALL